MGLGLFWSRIKARFAEEDIATIKRAGELALHDRLDAQATNQYAEAVKHLADALSHQSEGAVIVGSVVVIKSDSTGFAARTLTPTEVLQVRAVLDGKRAGLVTPRDLLDALGSAPMPVPDGSRLGQLAQQLSSGAEATEGGSAEIVLP